MTTMSDGDEVWVVSWESLRMGPEIVQWGVHGVKSCREDQIRSYVKRIQTQENKHHVVDLHDPVSPREFTYEKFRVNYKNDND